MREKSQSHPSPHVVIDGLKVPLYFLRPAQNAALEKMLSYPQLQLQSGDQVLEIGYGHPSLLLALAYSYNNMALGWHGSEVSEAPMTWSSWLPLLQMNIQLMTPHELSEYQSHFKLIYAVDVFKDQKDVKMGKPLALNKYELLRKFQEAYKLLAPGGRLLIVNDFISEIPLTRVDIEDIGFEVELWKEFTDELLYTFKDIRQLFALRKDKGDNYGVTYTYIFKK
ncbi:MAG: hypothetical protein KDD58_09525 [Bdellovibrionales bacterium]|nr:hypothetical protein [Bdellovibrionales bacterium]